MIRTHYWRRVAESFTVVTSRGRRRYFRLECGHTVDRKAAAGRRVRIDCHECWTLAAGADAYIIGRPGEPTMRETWNPETGMPVREEWTATDADPALVFQLDRIKDMADLDELHRAADLAGYQVIPDRTEPLTPEFDPIPMPAGREVAS